MTIQELSRYMNKRGTILVGVGSIEIPVRVTNVRVTYGRMEVQVTPQNGTGDAWVVKEKLRLERNGQ